VHVVCLCLAVATGCAQMQTAKLDGYKQPGSIGLRVQGLGLKLVLTLHLVLRLAITALAAFPVFCAQISLQHCCTGMRFE